MFKVLEGSGGDVLGVEISGGYTKQDFEQFKQACLDAEAAGSQVLNILCKIDNLQLHKIQPSALAADSSYALSHINQIRHIAIVGNSKFEEVLVKLDDKLLGSPKKERIEKYFDVSQLQQAWDFVRS